MWFVCAKGLVRFVDAAVHNGDFVSASVYRSELEVFRYVFFLLRDGETPKETLTTVWPYSGTASDIRSANDTCRCWTI